MRVFESSAGHGPAPKRGPRRYAANREGRAAALRFAAALPPFGTLPMTWRLAVKVARKIDQKCNLCRWENLLPMFLNIHTFHRRP
jgi:hypothetical protein